MKRFISFIKSKKGNAIDAAIITPVWIIVIAFLMAYMNFLNDYWQVERTSSNLAEILMLSGNYDSAMTNITAFESQNSKYTITIESISTYDSSTVYDASIYNLKYYWKEGNVITFKITKNTIFYGNPFSNLAGSLTQQTCSATTTVPLL